MADEADSKSVVGNNVRVQVPLPAYDSRRHLANAAEDKTAEILSLVQLEGFGCFITCSIIYLCAAYVWHGQRRIVFRRS